MSELKPILRRVYELRGPLERTVELRLGAPEATKRGARCGYQIIGMSDDRVRYAVGVDSLQALSLALAGLRTVLKTEMGVLCGFHDGLRLEWDFGSWETSLPYWIPLFDEEQLRSVEELTEQLFPEEALVTDQGVENDGSQES